MRSSSQKFQKKLTCPEANTILLFLSGELSARNAEPIARHLRKCDFCGAEAELLSRHPFQANSIDSPMIPEPLRLLAESLLIGRASDLDDLGRRNEVIGAFCRIP